MKKLFLGLVFILTLSFTSSCDSTPNVAYQPPILPVRLVIDSQGMVSIEGDASLATPIGIFSIGAEYYLNKDKEHIIVIIRDRTTNFDQIFKIQNPGDELIAVVNGRTIIQITDQQIIVDITEGNIETVEFKQAEISQSIPNSNPLLRAFSQKTWKVAEYNFWATRVAYDDSTIDKWYGFGFIWFLFRLVAASVCLIFDIIFMYFVLIFDIISAIGLFLEVLFSATVANIFYGVLSLSFAGFVFFSFLTSDPLIFKVLFFPITIFLKLRGSSRY